MGGARPPRASSAEQVCESGWVGQGCCKSPRTCSAASSLSRCCCCTSSACLRSASPPSREATRACLCAWSVSAHASLQGRWQASEPAPEPGQSVRTRPCKEGSKHQNQPAHSCPCCFHSWCRCKHQGWKQQGVETAGCGGKRAWKQHLTKRRMQRNHPPLSQTILQLSLQVPCRLQCSPQIQPLTLEALRPVLCSLLGLRQMWERVGAIKLRILAFEGQGHQRSSTSA